MQVQKISFTSDGIQNNQKKDSALYTKRGYMWQLGTDQFLIGTFAGYGLLEAVDKFQLIKNKNNLSPKALKQKAWKHTKYNILAGLATGIASTLLGTLFINKHTVPIAEKAFDNLEKQEQINAKVKELIKQSKEEKAEDKASKTSEENKSSEPKNDTSEKTEQEEQKTDDKVTENKISDTKTQEEKDSKKEA